MLLLLTEKKLPNHKDAIVFNDNVYNKPYENLTYFKYCEGDMDMDIMIQQACTYKRGKAG